MVNYGTYFSAVENCLAGVRCCCNRMERDIAVARESMEINSKTLVTFAGGL
jgi:hypothetical protein